MSAAWGEREQKRNAARNIVKWDNDKERFFIRDLKMGFKNPNSMQKRVGLGHFHNGLNAAQIKGFLSPREFKGFQLATNQS
jgi:hypothetical protein